MLLETQFNRPVAWPWGGVWFCTTLLARHYVAGCVGLLGRLATGRRTDTPWRGYTAVACPVPRGVYRRQTCRRTSGGCNGLPSVVPRWPVSALLFAMLLPFGQFTAYQLVCDLIRAALMRGLRMAVERSHAEGIYTGLISKFRAIVAGQCLEDHVPIAAYLALEPLQGP